MFVKFRSVFLGICLVACSFSYAEDADLVSPEHLDVDSYTFDESGVYERDYEAEKNITHSLACINLSGNLSGFNVSGGSFVVARSYTSSCAGAHYHTGSITEKNPSSAYIRLRLQKFNGGSWNDVASGYSYSYRGTPGQYRILVVNLGSVYLSSWKAKYKHPI